MAYQGSVTRTHRVSIPMSEELNKAKKEAQKITGALISGRGQPNSEDMVERLKAMSERLKLFQCKYYRIERGLLVEFPDERTLEFFTSRKTPISCPRGTFRVHRWRLEEEVIIRGLPPFAWSINTLEMIVREFGHLIELDPATASRSKPDRARVLIESESEHKIPSVMDVILGGDRWTVSIEIKFQAKKKIDFETSSELRQPTSKNLTIFQWVKKSNHNSTGGMGLEQEDRRSTQQTHVTVQANSTKHVNTAKGKENMEASRTKNTKRSGVVSSGFPLISQRRDWGDNREPKRLRSSIDREAEYGLRGRSIAQAIVATPLKICRENPGENTETLGEELSREAVQIKKGLGLQESEKGGL